MRTCSKCKQQKPPEEFSKDKRHKDGLDSYCKLCLVAKYYERHEIRKEQSKKYAVKNREVNRIRSSKFYEDNKEAIKAYSRAYAKRNRVEIRIRQRDKKKEAVALLGGQCVICLKEYPSECYDFHHLHPEEKEWNIKDLLACSWERLNLELTKCILVCSNCHRTLHYQEK